MKHIVPIALSPRVVNALAPGVNAPLVDVFISIHRPEIIFVVSEPFRIRILHLALCFVLSVKVLSDLDQLFLDIGNVRLPDIFDQLFVSCKTDYVLMLHRNIGGIIIRCILPNNCAHPVPIAEKFICHAFQIMDLVVINANENNPFV